MSTYQQAYSKLNPKQKEAVDSIYGPVLVIAGPGTGKTQILTLRIANILLKTDVKPNSILALTFTENAAKNMQERLIEFIGPDAYRVKITTFHSFANDIIQNSPERFIFHEDLKQLDDLTRYTIIKSMLDSYEVENLYEGFRAGMDEDAYAMMQKKPKVLKPFSAPYFYQHDILNSIDKLKREYVSSERFEELIREEIKELDNIEKINPKTKKPYTKWSDQAYLIHKNIELYYLYSQYEKYLKDEGYYDFNDMINFVTDAFKSDEEFLAYYQEKYLFTLVDEYQDTNGAQNEIIKSLGSFDSDPNIFVVGDDDQSIFRFQGANLKNIIDFNTTYPSTKLITITQNYRSTQTVLDLAQSLIENNSERLVNEVENLDKDLTSALGEKGEKAKLAELSRGEVEYYWISEEIKRLNETGVELKDIAVIYHRHSDGREIIDTLERAEIPVNVIINEDILKSDTVCKVINLLKIIRNPLDNQLFAEVLEYDFFGFDRLDIFKLITFVGKKKLNIFDVLLDIEKLNESGVTNTIKFQAFANKLFEYRRINQNTTFVNFLHQLAEETKLLDHLKNKKMFDDMIDLKALFDFAKQRNEKNLRYRYDQFLNDVEVMENSNIPIYPEDIGPNNEGVNMLTAHSSKGLEFEYVFIPKLIDKTWGNVRSFEKIKLVDIFDDHNPDKEEKNEEERRLLFVALTRAKKQLYLSFSNKYKVDDDKARDAVPSQFLAELDKGLIEKIDVDKYEKSAEEVIALSLKQPEPFNFNTKEEEYLRQLVDRFKLSASALNTYIEDPQKFLYEYLLRIPKSTNKNLHLGSAVHSALDKFYRGIMRDENPQLEHLSGHFKAALKNILLDELEHTDILNEGNRILTDWHGFYSDKFIKPIATEYPFYGRGVYLSDIPLVGKIDKIEWVDEKEKLAKIIDYKTSSPLSRNSIMKSLDTLDGKYLRQLIFYKLLADLDPDFKYNVVESQLDFLKGRNGKFKQESFEVTEQDIKDLKEIIYDVMAKIRELRF